MIGVGRDVIPAMLHAKAQSFKVGICRAAKISWDTHRQACVQWECNPPVGQFPHGTPRNAGSQRHDPTQSNKSQRSSAPKVRENLSSVASHHLPYLVLRNMLALLQTSSAQLESYFIVTTFITPGRVLRSREPWRRVASNRRPLLGKPETSTTNPS